MYSAVVLMNKICAQSEWCAQIKLLVGGSLDVKEERLESRGSESPAESWEDVSGQSE